jgi:hypothetical protein
MALDKDIVQNINTFKGGMNKDLAQENIPNEQYLDANDIKVTADEENDIVRIGAANSMLPFGLPNSKTNNTKQTFILTLDVSAANINHTFSFLGSSITLFSTQVTEALRRTDLVSQINSEWLAGGITYVSGSIVGGIAYGYFSFNINPNEGELTVKIGSGATKTMVVLEEKYNYVGASYADVVCAKAIGDDLFMLIDINGTGMIAVAKKDEANNTWTTTRLLQTTKLTFDKDSVTFLKLEQNNGYINLYWVDGVGKPRCFSILKQDTWVEDSALRYSTTDFVTGNLDALYQYGTVEQQTSLQVFNNQTRVTDVVVNDTAGFFKSGNKQLAIRYKIGGTYTEFSLLTNPFPIYFRTQTDAIGGGGIPNIDTTKSLTITIDKAKDNLYEFFQIGVIEQVGLTKSAFVLGDFSVLGETFSLTILGNENKQSIDINEFLAVSPAIKTAHLNEIMENKYFLGRVETVNSYYPDIADWVENTVFASGNISIVATEIDSSIYNASTAVMPNNEYYNVQNCLNKVGYMYNELYRMGLKVYFKSGAVQTYFGRDIKIENDITTKYGHLTSADGLKVYVYSPRINSINFSTAPSVDGISFIDAVETVEVVRQECIRDIVDTGYTLPPTILDLGTGLYACGAKFGNDNEIVYATSNKYGFYISPSVTQQRVQITKDFKCRNYIDDPNVIRTFTSQYISTTSGTNHAFYTEYSGNFVVPTPRVNITEFNNVVYVDFNSSEYLNATRGITNKNPLVGTSSRCNSIGYGLYCTGLNVIASSYTQGNYAQIYIGLSDNRYGDKFSGQYFSTGCFIDVSSTSITNQLIFGGDTYTQGTYQKISYLFSPSSPSTGIASMAKYYSQNRFNAQLQYNDTTIFDFPFNANKPAMSFVNNSAQESPKYDGSFTNLNTLRTTQAFNPNIPEITDYFSTVFWSEQKLEGDLSDPYRVFKFSNQKAFEMSDGILTGMYRIREVLAIIQERGFKVQPISPNVAIQGQDVSDIILGTGTVMGTKEMSISRNGAKYKTSSTWYLSKSGTEYVAFYDSDNKKIIRYGVDGIKQISETNFVANFLLNNTRYLEGEYSMYVGYNPYTDEVLFIAKADLGSVYNSGSNYSAGQIAWQKATDTTGGFTYDDSKYYFQAIINNTNVPLNYTGSTFNTWKEYRNSNFMLAFNEKWNMFSTFYTFKPRITATYLNKMIGFYPFTQGGLTGTRLLEFDNGNTANYIQGVSKYPMVEVSIAKEPNIFKRFLKSWINIDGGLPSRVITTTDNGTAANITTFTERRERVLFNILKDFYATGKRVGGNKIKLKLYFLFNQKIHNIVNTIILKFRQP